MMSMIRGAERRAGFLEQVEDGRVDCIACSVISRCSEA